MVLIFISLITHEIEHFFMLIVHLCFPLVKYLVAETDSLCSSELCPFSPGHTARLHFPSSLAGIRACGWNLARGMWLEVTGAVSRPGLQNSPTHETLFSFICWLVCWYPGWFWRPDVEDSWVSGSLGAWVTLWSRASFDGEHRFWTLPEQEINFYNFDCIWHWDWGLVVIAVSRP